MLLKVTVPVEKLQDPGVAAAVKRLVLALGGRAEAPAKPAPAPAKLPAVQAPRPQASKPRSRPSAARPEPGPMDLAAFQQSLPDRSRRFLETLAAQKTVRVREMLAVLGLTSAKALGGITGAIARWAPVRGVTLPYETITLDGERAWRWVGEGGTAAPSRRPVATSPAAMVRPPSEPPRSVGPFSLDELMEAVSPSARSFLSAVREAGILPLADARRSVGDRSSVSAVLAELEEVIGIRGPEFFEDTVDIRGAQIFKWKVAGPKSPSAPTTPPLKREYATDGVIRRRRKVVH